VGSWRGLKMSNITEMMSRFTLEKNPKRKKEIAQKMYSQMDLDWENTQEQIASVEECFGKY
jgi:hypothetical protein